MAARLALQAGPGRDATSSSGRPLLLATAAGAAALGALLLALVLGAPAQAVLVRTPSGHTVSFQPTIARARTGGSLTQSVIRMAGRPSRTTSSPTASTTTTTAGGYTPCSQGEGACLSYYGGPVMRTTTLTPIFWSPAGLGLKYPAGYEEEIEGFLANLAADSGKETNFFSLLPQYYEEVGATINRVAYSVTAGAALQDTDALPTALGDTCTSPLAISRPCVQDEGVRAELRSFVKGHSLATGIGHEYIVFFPEGIDSCFNEGSAAKEPICSGTSYCGYHGTLNATTSEEMEYANEPDNGDPQYKGGCSGAPNVTAAAATINTTSHEVSESVTDPQVGAPYESWYDRNKLFVEEELEPEYGEIGDMCAWQFAQGTKVMGVYYKEGGAKEGETNQTINGHRYLLQTEWDNAHSTCSISAEAASAAAREHLIASFLRSPEQAVPTGETVSFDGSGSSGPVAISRYEWNWGDSSPTLTSASPTATHTYTTTKGLAKKTFTVTLTVTDSEGKISTTSKTVEVNDRKPSASFTAPSGAPEGSAVTFDGSSSSDPDGTIASYRWNWGDGSSATGANPSHTYVKAGTYNVTLTVADDAGQTESVSHPVTIVAAASLVTVEGSGSSLGTQTGSGAFPLGAGNISPLTFSSPPPPSNAVRIVSSTSNKNGTFTLKVFVPGPGVLSLQGAAAHPRKKHATGDLVRPEQVDVPSGQTVTLQVIPVRAARVALAHRRNLSVRLLITFSPVGGTPRTIRRSLILRRRAGRKRG